MANRVRTLDFLPEIFRTESNSQFLGATLDQLVTPPKLDKIEGYIGRKFEYGLKDGICTVSSVDVLLKKNGLNAF